MPNWHPNREADPLEWLQNFALKFDACLRSTGIIAADVRSIINVFNKSGSNITKPEGEEK